MFKLKNISISLFLIILLPICLNAQEQISLNGTWQMGEKRNYHSVVEVPGVHTDPTKMNADTLWYRRTVVLPKGLWTYATLELK